MITAEQYRAARALVAWRREDLAEKSLVAVATIADFETSRRRPQKRTLAALRTTLETAGVAFIDPNGGRPGGSVDWRPPMPLRFHPSPGTILMCDYGTGFILPEMVKVRPVVVVSPRFRTRPKLCTVVPLSSTEPRPRELYHHCLSAGAYPPARGPMWAKCDMLATVSIDRLDRIKTRGRGGKRSYVTFAMPPDDMAAVMACVRVALGFVD